MPPRVSRAVLLSAILLVPIGRAPADTIIERVYVPTTSILEVPTYTTTSATVYVPSTYTTTSTVLRPTTYTLSPTAYVVPTSTRYVVPTSSVVRTSYVVPTRYVVPSSYIVPTTYVTRRYVPTTLSLVPTSVSTLLRTSAEVPLCCGDSAPVLAADPCDTGTRTLIESPLGGETRVETIPADEPIDPPSTPNGVLRSGPSDPVVNPDADSTRSGDAPALDPKTLQSTPRSQPANPPTPPAAPSGSDVPAPLSDVPPPSSTLIEPTTPEVPLGDEPPAPSAVPATPPHDPAPPLNTPSGSPGAAATADHSAMRPALDRNVNTAAAPRTGVATGTRSMLQGRVVSAATGAPEKGLNVVISSAVGRFRDRTVTTDNDGRFTAVLPEGDWTVRVPTAGSSSVDSVWPITVAGGLITDDQDREIATLTINR